MKRLFSFLLVFSVGSALFIAYHRYLWTRLVRDVELPAPWRSVATYTLVLLAALVLVTLPIARLGPRDLARPLAFGAFTWMGLSFLLFVAVLSGDFLRALGYGAAWLGHVELDAPKRLTMARTLATGAALFGIGAGGWGMRTALHQLRVQSVRIPLRNLTPAMHGTSIVQISDIHIGPTLGHDFLANVVARVNELSPDIIAITGDLVDGSVEQLREHVAPLADLRATYGVYFVTGNHEYYSGAIEWVEEFTRLGIRVLRNEHVNIGPAGDHLHLAGVDDWTAAQHERDHGHALPRALHGRDIDREVILLAHQPRSAFEAAAHGVGLQLSGHTHGGQIVPWNWLVRLQQPFVAGLYRLRNTWVYVNSGTGYWGPPMRVGTHAEITRIELVRGEV